MWQPFLFVLLVISAASSNERGKPSARQAIEARGFDNRRHRLLDLSGKVLCPDLSNHGRRCFVGHTRIDATSVSPDGQVLELVNFLPPKCDVRAERKKARDEYLAALTRVQRALADDQIHLSTLAAHPGTLNEKDEEEYLRLAGELAPLTSQLNELSQKTTVRIHHHERRITKTVRLRRGVVTDCEWSALPLIWTAAAETTTTEVELDFEEDLEVVKQEEGPVMVAVGLKSVEVYEPARDRWVGGPAMPTGRSMFGIAAVHDEVYVSGGVDEDWTPLASVIKHDIAGNTWKKVADMTKHRRLHAMAELDGSLYVTGGTDRSGAFSCGERYDPFQDRWFPIANMNTKRFAHAMVGFKDSLIVAGGFFLDTVEQYNPATNRWVFLASMNTPRDFFGLGVLDGTLYAVGGKHTSSVEKYDSEKDMWVATVADMKSSSRKHGVAVLDGTMYAIGGAEHAAEAKKYDKEANRWIEITPPSAASFDFGIVVTNR